MPGRLRRVLSLGLVWVLASLIGCGGDEDGVSEFAEPPARAAEAVASELFETLEKARQGEDCEDVRPIIRRSTYKVVCPQLEGLRRIRDFEVDASARYGTGAVIDYTTRKSPDGASLVMLLTPRGEWALSRFGLVTERPAVGSSDDTSRAGFARAARRYVAAARRRDCDAYAPLVFAEYSDERRFCREAFDDPKAAIVRALESDPKAKPRYLGGNRYVGFFGVEAGGPRPAYVTIVMVATVDGALEPYVVFDAQAGPIGADA